MKNCIFFVCSVIVLLSVSVWAEQPPEQVWEARYNGPGNYDDEARALAIDNSGNVYVTGFSKDASGTYDDYATIKYGPDGNQLWVARYNGPGNGNDWVWDLAIDNLGNVYVTGYSFVAYSYNYDYATIKYGPDGNQLWVARYNGPANGYDRAWALAVDNSGNVYVTGSSDGGGTYGDYATIKYGPNGNQLWVARYNGPANDYDQSSVLSVDNSGNVYVTGESWGGSTELDYATIKYGTNGNQLWVARYNGPANGYDRPSALSVDNSGNVYVTGYSEGGGTGDDYATIKYGPNGSQLWVARYNGSGNSSEAPTALAIDNFGNVYVTGYSLSSITGNDYVTIKYGQLPPFGFPVQLWVARYSSPAYNDDEAFDLSVDNLGNVYVTGYSLSSITGSDYVTIKYGPDGNQLWVTRYNGPGNDFDWALALAIDNSGNVYVTGGSDGISTGRDYATIKYTQHDYCISPFPRDLSRDCKVDFADFAILAEDWLEDTYLEDLAELAEDWLECNFALKEDCF